MRIGLIGAGSVAELHAAAADRIPGVQLSAVCDLREDAAARVAAPRSAAVFTDWRALLDDASVDAIIVNTPHSLHRAMTVAAADRGIHVLVEKPMAITLADCDEMVSACASAGVRLVVGHIQHFLPDKVAAMSVLEHGELGPPMLLHDYRSTDYRPGSRPAWFLSHASAGGGVLMNIGTHCVDRCLWLAGGNVVEVAAATGSRFDVPVETDASLLLQLDNGASAAVTVVSDSYATIDELTVVCEGGSLVADPRRGTLLRRDGRTTTIREAAPDDVPDAFHAQLADFVSCVRDGVAPAVSLGHARQVIEVILTCYTVAGRELSHERAAAPAQPSGDGFSRA